MYLIAGSKQSVFQHFEIYVRTEAIFSIDDIDTILKEFTSQINIYELPRDIYTAEDLAKILWTFGLPQIVDGVLSMKSKLSVSKLSWSVGGATNPKIPSGYLNFDEKSFFITLLGFTPHWDHKPNKN